METKIKQAAKLMLDILPEDDVVEVLSFIHYLQWRREEIDQSWFLTDEWQKRYQESQQDLSEGRFLDFDDVEELLAELKVSENIE